MLEEWREALIKIVTKIHDESFYVPELVLCIRIGQFVICIGQGTLGGEKPIELISKCKSGIY